MRRVWPPCLACQPATQQDPPRLTDAFADGETEALPQIDLHSDAQIVQAKMVYAFYWMQAGQRFKWLTARLVGAGVDAPARAGDGAAKMGLCVAVVLRRRTLQFV